VRYRRSTSSDQAALISEYLDVHEHINRDDAIRLFEVTPNRASAILATHRRSGLIEAVGATHGRSVRYRRSSSAG
jgi:hypothetical protein